MDIKHHPWSNDAISPSLTGQPNVSRHSESEAEKRLALALDLGRMGAWTWIMAEDRVECDLGAEQGDSYSGPLQGFLAHVHPEDRDAVREALERSYSAEQDYAQTYRFAFSSVDQYKAIEVRARLHQGGEQRPSAFIGVVRPAPAYETEQKTPSRFRALFLAAQDAVLIADNNRRYVDANPAAAHLFGLPVNQIIGQSIDDFVDEVRDSKVGAAWQEFQATGVQRGECRLRRADGSFCYAEYSAKSNFAPGLHLSIMRDVTERKRSEQILARQSAELVRSNADLQQFAYSTSHDLQEPLRSIISFSQMLSKRYTGQLGSDADEFLGYITTGAYRMKGMIDSLLKYSRVLNQDVTPFAFVPLGDPLHWAMENLQAGIEETGARVTHDTLPIVFADKVLLTALFQNLISNAIKYRKDRTPPEICISAEQQESRQLVCVRDNGVGIPAEQSERVFDVFKRLHGQEIPGTGIGLAICKRIVEKHGGEIWVTSEPSQGSAFCFTLPIADTLEPA
jgi:PAS domain S-box-containing protein